jgi:hypothetical protein
MLRERGFEVMTAVTGRRAGRLIVGVARWY